MQHPDNAVIQIRILDAVATIVLNRPEKRNALSRDMCVALRDAVRSADANDAIRVILLRANGSAFCAGADLSERKAMTADEVRARRLLAFSAYDAIENVSKPCIAVVEGPAVGAGAEIAASCDFIVATEHASFRYPEVGWGTIGATQRLPELVGRRTAKDLLFTGRKLEAREAFELGLVSRLVDSEALAAQLDALCASIVSAPPAIIATAKRCVDDRAHDTRRTALAVEVLAIEELLAGDSWRNRVGEFGKSA